jgi:hypothetical protein
MKKIILVLSISFIVGTLTSCKGDFLNRGNPRAISQDQVFKNEKLMKLSLNNFYANIPSPITTRWVVLFGNIADNSRDYWRGAPVDIIKGNWGPTSNPMEYWSSAYQQIRHENTFLSKLKGSPVDEKTKKIMKGETKFIRALEYFKMIKRYGGVPIITKPQSLNSNKLLVKRQSTDSSFKFVINELKEAANLLPATYGSRDIDVGKANKWSAKAILGKVLLYWASPLYNPQNIKSRWARAAKVNKEVIESKKYSLLPNFRDIMLDKNNQEEIFSIQYQKPYKQHGWDSMNMPDSHSQNDAVRFSPVLEFAKSFDMKNGKPINAPNSGWNPHIPERWQNRDPRFYATIITDNSLFRGFHVDMSINSLTKDQMDVPYATITGFLMKKGTDESNPDFFGRSGSDQNWQVIRFGEVLLNYAEAENEALSSPNTSVYNAIDRIRKRAGLDPYKLPQSLTKKQMRKAIRHERRVELAFENERYWDLRRWKTAIKRLNGKSFHGLYITEHKHANDTTYTYKLKTLKQGPYVFTKKMYFMPIPESEIRKNPNLKQNPGWD